MTQLLVMEVLLRVLVTTLALALTIAATAAAEQPVFSVRQQLFAADLTGSPAAGPLTAAPAAAQLATAGTYDTEHMLGVGVRVGGFEFGIGGSFRYFFGGPFGIQVEVSHYGVDYDDDIFGGDFDFGSTQFAPAVIYRFLRTTFEAPLVLQPYAGGGLSIIRSGFGDDFEDIFPEEDEVSVGALVFGGVELFFERVPKLGVSGELTFNSNDDLPGASLGGPAFTAAAHWYFR